MTFVTVLEILYHLLTFYWYIMLAGVILTWVPGLYQFKIARLIKEVSDWYLSPFEGKIIFGFIDFTPVIGFMIYSGCLSLLVEVLRIIYSGS